jgi:hypothetical protein
LTKSQAWEQDVFYGRCQQAGKIYAMGGIFQYTGDLVPTDVVEVLDTANIAAGWTAVASLPMPTAEGWALALTLIPCPSIPSTRLVVPRPASLMIFLRQLLKEVAECGKMGVSLVQKCRVKSPAN